MAFVCLLLILGLHFGTNVFAEKELVRVKREGVNLNVTAVLEPPFLMEVKDKAQTGNDRYEGYVMDILEEIGQRKGIGFTVNIQKDSSYTGMIQELIDKEADMAVGPITITRERETKIDLTKPFMNAGITIMLKKPKRALISVDTSIFMKPFEPVVWICIILAACVVVGCFYVINRFNPHEKDNCEKGHKEGQKRQGDKKGPNEQKELSFGILACLWMVLSGLTLQGYTKRPKSASALILFFVWWVFCLVVFAFYIGGILTSGVYDPVEVMKTPIKSFDDLVKQTRIRFGAVKGGATAQFFERSNVEVYERAAKMMKDDPSVMVSSSKEGVQRVRMENGEYAFLVESPLVEYVAQRSCDVMKVGGLLNSIRYGFGLQLNSPHTDVINVGILELQEEQILQQLYNKWWYSTGMCSVSKPKTENDVRMCGRIIRPLSMGNIGGIFIVFFVGILIAMIVTVIETLVHRRREAQKTDKSDAEKKDEQPLHEVALT